MSRVVKSEHHLEDGRPARVAGGLKLGHQLLERQVLMRVRGQRASRTRPSSSTKLGEPPRSTRSTSVFTKKPIRPSSSAASGRRSASRAQVRLAAVAGQQRLERRQQGHEQRRPSLPAELLQRAAETRRLENQPCRPAEALQRRPRAIGRAGPATEPPAAARRQ